MSDTLPRRPERPPGIIVLGDVMLDRYTWGNVERVSPEAPIPILSADQEEVRPGGAASVAALLSQLEAHVTLLGVVGNDSEATVLERVLREHHVDVEGLVRVPERPTTCKQRFIGRAAGRHPHQMLRVDREVCSAINEPTETTLIDCLRQMLSECEAVLVSDYGKGVCTPRVLRQVIELCRSRSIPVLVDPARGVAGEHYRCATLLTPNRSESQLLAGTCVATPKDAIDVAQRLRAKLELDAVLVTLDREGLVVADAAGVEHLSTTPREVYDITGAGDMVLVICGYGSAAGWPLRETARWANVAAGLEVERFGVEPVTWAEIESEVTRASSHKVCTLQEAVAFAERAHRAGKRVVLTNGCFDLFHAGHLRTIEEAVAQGDVLIVAVNSDASVHRLKGAGRPVIHERQRADVIAALSCVDRVVIFDEETPHALLMAILPDVLVKGGSTGDIIGCEVVEEYGGRVHRAALVPNLSTTDLITSFRTNGMSSPVIPTKSTEHQ